MSSEWQTVRVCELGRVVTGKTPSTKDTENFGGTFPFITIPDLGESRFVISTERTLSDKGARLVRSAALPAGAVLMSCIATVGKRGITTQQSFTNQQINAVICGDDVHSQFLYYAFSELARDLDSSGSGGSVYTNVSKSRFENMSLRIPALAEQVLIADFLGSLDDRIDNLRATNATLEAIAQAIFKSWFIDFDPVRAKMEGRDPEGMDAETAALFPSEFEESELGLIPRGWKVVPVEQIAKISGGKQLSRDEFIDEGEFPIFGGAGVMGRANRANAEGFVIVLGRVGAYCGQFFWHRGPAWVNNNASLVTPINRAGEWLINLMWSIDMNKIKKGAAQPFVSNGDLGRVEVADPGSGLIAEFAKLGGPLFERIASLQSELNAIAQIRDNLLPRLISGKLKLPERVES